MNFYVAYRYVTTFQTIMFPKRLAGRTAFLTLKTTRHTCRLMQSLILCRFLYLRQNVSL